MTKEQIKRALNSFTKDELIEGLIESDNNLLVKLIGKLNAKAYVKENKKIDAARKAWEKASKAHIKYLNKVKDEYEGVSIYNLPREVRLHLAWLQHDEEQKYKHLINLQDKQQQRLDNMIVRR